MDVASRKIPIDVVKKSQKMCPLMQFGIFLLMHLLIDILFHIFFVFFNCILRT